MKKTERKGGTAVEHDELLAVAVPPLIEWYENNRRADLPWRQDASPYRVWISEIMLQQTRIETVIPYYIRFLRRLPDAAALAAVPDDELMKLWEGLGYYSRARNLKKAAGIVAAEHGGELPRTAEQLRRLPGIGDYTAGAIASIACGEPEPAVDGNVLRVLARLTESDDDVTKEKTKKLAAEKLRKVYPSGRKAGLLTEGLMELGETVCIPNGAPLCSRCPWKELCLCRRHGTQEAYPVRAEKKERRAETLTVLLLEQEGRFALCRRPPSGLLAGMWQLPNVPGALTEDEVRRAVEDLGLMPDAVRPAGSGRHLFTHVEWNMTGWRVQCRGTGKAAENGLAWFTPDEIRTGVALPSAFRTWRRKITENGD